MKKFDYKNRLNSFKKRLFEFLLIFISVFLAFLLAEWSKSRGDKLSEKKLLEEISNGIKADFKDFEVNVRGHQMSLRAVAFFRDWMQHKPVVYDSLAIFYDVLYRNFTPIIHKSGYESLKASNVKTITNDSLRFRIINLHDYYYNILEKLEDEVEEMQDFRNFFRVTNDMLSAYMEFDDTGRLTKLSPPTHLSVQQQQQLMSGFWKTENNKKFKLLRYGTVMSEILKVDAAISNELRR